MKPEQWDVAAATFDDEPDHGLTDPVVREAWRSLLLSVLPSSPAAIADLGCGTGTLAGLLVDENYAVHGVDFSPAMIERAASKVPEANFTLGDAADPDLANGRFDAVLCRHVLWALPDPLAAVNRWFELLRDDGVVVLVEGRWHTGGGLTAQEAMAIMESASADATLRHLTDALYWGKPIDDERYLIVAHRSSR